MTARILIVDDEEVIVRSCTRVLTEAGYEVISAADGPAGLARLSDTTIDLMILDIMMPRMSGLEVLRRVKEGYPDIDVIMVTGLAEIDTAVKSMKLGAFDYLAKPFDPDELRLAVQRALERRELLRENANLRTEIGAKYRFENIIGSSPAMQKVYRLISQCAPTNSTVLITGESGTGKELIARAIHYNSLRREKPFLAVDCNSLSETLLESELFGHVKGAFTGAVSNKTGMFEAADGGTLFLDEIGNLSLSIQAKLLRVLQEREYRAVGDTRSRTTNIRLLTATNKNLPEMVAEGTFREDLYYRINVFPIQMPPLRERCEDIPALAFHFLKAFREELGKDVAEFSDPAMDALVHYQWPGNVRELENIVHRAAILANGTLIREAHLSGIAGSGPLPDHPTPRTSDELKRLKKIAREKSVEEIERRFILDALDRNDWNVTRSAEETGMQRTNFQALMKKHRIRARGNELDAGEEL